MTKLTLTTPAKLGLLGAGLLLVLAIGWFALINPKRSEASDLSSQIETTRAQIAAANAVPSGTRAPTIRVADLFKLSRAMPNTTDMPGVLLQLSRVARESGVSFDSITPHDPVQAGAYQQVDIDLAFEGRFYELSDFLYRLRNLVGVRDGVLNATGRLFTVRSVSFGEGTLKFPRIKATLAVSAFVFGDGTGSAVPPAATSPTAPTVPASEGSQPIPAAPYGATAAGA